MYKKKSCRCGFLLIELVTALAILSILFLVVSSSLWKSVQWQYEAQMQLKALNIATSQIEKMVEGHKVLPAMKKDLEGYSIIFKNENVNIVQKKIDAIISPSGLRKSKSSIMGFEPVSVVSEWTSSSGKKRKLRILTGILKKKEFESGV